MSMIGDSQTLSCCPYYIKDYGFIYDYNHGIISIEFVSYLIAVPIQAILGILGNGIAYFVARKINDRITKLYLSYLATFNALVCIFALIYPFLDQYATARKMIFINLCAWIILVRKVVLILSGVFKKASILIITTFFLDRFIAVSRPTKVQAWRNSSFHSYVPALAILLPLMLSLPMLKWYDIHQCSQTLISINGILVTSDNTSLIYDHLHGRIVDKSRGFGNISDDMSCFPRKTYCYKTIRARGRNFVVYEIFRELILTFIPSAILTYFALKIAFSILRLKQKAKKRVDTSSMVLQFYRQSVITNSPLQSNQNNTDSLKPPMTKAERLESFRKKREGSFATTSRLSSGKQIVGLLFGFIGLYCLSIIPASIMTLLYSLSYSVENTPRLDNLREQWSSVITIGLVLDLANYCWCFYLYTILDVTFRKALFLRFHMFKNMG